jgi:hypothetical protein
LDRILTAYSKTNDEAFDLFYDYLDKCLHSRNKSTNNKLPNRSERNLRSIERARARSEENGKVIPKRRGKHVLVWIWSRGNAVLWGE